MKAFRPPHLPAVAATVAAALRRAGISAVLTGGACAAIHSHGAYESSDLDFILERETTQRVLDDAMGSVGFQRDGDRYVHTALPFWVEFPRGPLGIGRDLDVKPVEIRVGHGRVRTLSAFDSCRDRLAAFYHWADRQALDAAVEIAHRKKIDPTRLRAWSEKEGASSKFEEFRGRVSGRSRGARRSAR